MGQAYHINDLKVFRKYSQVLHSKLLFLYSLMTHIGKEKIWQDASVKIWVQTEVTEPLKNYKKTLCILQVFEIYFGTPNSSISKIDPYSHIYKIKSFWNIEPRQQQQQEL